MRRRPGRVYPASVCSLTGPSCCFSSTVKKTMSVEAGLAAWLVARSLTQQRLSVAVMSAYGPQAGLYRRLLQGMPRVQAGTVHTMQGREADVAMYDPVDPGRWFVAVSTAAPRLANVAVSLARRQVVLVGKRSELKTNRWLQEMVRVAADGEAG